MEFGRHGIAQVDVMFRPGQRPTGARLGPSPEMAAFKIAFGADRIKRWFDRDWRTSG